MKTPFPGNERRVHQMTLPLDHFWFRGLETVFLNAGGWQSRPTFFVRKEFLPPPTVSSPAKEGAPEERCTGRERTPFPGEARSKLFSWRRPSDRKHRELWENPERLLNTSLQFIHLAFLSLLLKRL
jgi:hypothetical protein